MFEGMCRREVPPALGRHGGVGEGAGCIARTIDAIGPHGCDEPALQLGQGAENELLGPATSPGAAQYDGALTTGDEPIALVAARIPNKGGTGSSSLTSDDAR